MQPAEAAVSLALICNTSAFSCYDSFITAGKQVPALHYPGNKGGKAAH